MTANSIIMQENEQLQSLVYLLVVDGLNRVMVFRIKIFGKLSVRQVLLYYPIFESI